jgi:uncharacterized SAM-binding protein YcdF (DUF218 family)
VVLQYVQPSSVLLISIVIGLLGVIVRPSRLAMGVLVCGVAALALCAWTPVTLWIMKPLEQRFAPFRSASSVTGIVVIGGAFDVVQSLSGRDVSFNLRGARMTAFAELSRRYPRARLIFSGGKASTDLSLSEAAIARRLFINMGIDVARVLFEARSRNTHENAEFSRRLVTLHKKDRWLLVTSAADMPRAVGSFRSVGWPVIAFPVDYHTQDGWSTPGLGRGLEMLDWSLHEWTGLLYYRLRGWIPTVFPGPDASR